MLRLEVRDLSVRYSGRPVVNDINFGLEEGRIGCLLGPSGCGKTTILRAIAGFAEPHSGSILVDGREIWSASTIVPPELRNVGLVFQDYALFPHLSASDNLAFGLKSWPHAERRARVSELLKFVDMETHAKAFPHELSGGEQQRIALARAMAPRPSVLLLDEPFSSMDVELREQLVGDVRHILRGENVTAVLVTHDQHEAFAMADEVCVMNAGNVQQRDVPYNIYHHPATRFVADFIGEGVFIAGTVGENGDVNGALGPLSGRVPTTFSAGDEIDVLIRPDDVVYDAEGALRAKVTDRAFRGSTYLYTLMTDAGTELLSLMQSHLRFDVGDEVRIRLDLQDLTVYPR